MGTPSRSNRERLVSVMNDHLIRLNLSRVVAPIGTMVWEQPIDEVEG
jgi:hypothetical protein